MQKHSKHSWLEWEVKLYIDSMLWAFIVNQQYQGWILFSSSDWSLVNPIQELTAQPTSHEPNITSKFLVITSTSG